MKRKTTIVTCSTLCISVLGIIEKVFGFINKIIPISPNLWFILFVGGLVSTIIYYYWDKIREYFIPDISWHNDGFAYMTIEARFRDNFNKTGYKFNAGKSNDNYAIFCNQKAMNSDCIIELHQGDKRNDAKKYRTKGKRQWKKEKHLTKLEIARIRTQSCRKRRTLFVRI